MQEIKSVHNIEINGKSVSFELTRKNVKNINMRLKPDGRILVSANSRVRLEQIENMIENYSDNIISYIENLEKKKIENKGKGGENKDIILFLGRTYQRKIVKAAKDNIEIEGDYFYIYTLDIEDGVAIESKIEQFIEKQTVEILGDLFEKRYLEFTEICDKLPTLKFRKMTSRWGSCIPSKNKITLNKWLIQAPIECIDYVIVHEYCHFIHPNHSADFYKEVEKHCPEWKRYRNMLKLVDAGY